MSMIFPLVLAVFLIASTGSGDMPSVMVVRTNPSGQEGSVFAEPLMTYKQAERIIRQNEEIIRLLKEIERNTKRR